MSEEVILTVDGAVERPLKLSCDDLDALPDVARVRDVSRFHPKRQGDGVELEAILDRAGVSSEANYLTLHADRDDFHVSIPLQPVREQGIVVYRLGEGLLGLEHGGPVRFLVRDPAACNTGELDRVRQREIPEPDRAHEGSRARHPAGRRIRARRAASVPATALGSLIGGRGATIAS